MEGTVLEWLSPRSEKEWQQNNPFRVETVCECVDHGSYLAIVEHDTEVSLVPSPSLKKTEEEPGTTGENRGKPLKNHGKPWKTEEELAKNRENR